MNQSSFNRQRHLAKIEKKSRSLFKIVIGFSLALGMPTISSAAIPSRGMGNAHRAEPTKITIDATKNALKLPIDQRIQLLMREGEQGYRNLVGLMFNDALPMEIRWRAVTASGRIAGALAKPELKRAFQSHDWYMRNAALVSMAHIDRATATDWARRLMSDKSLVVRTAAVSAIAQFQDQASAPLLWEKLYSKENFRGKQGLFIRRRIVEALARLKPAGSESQFIEVLADNDKTLHPAAIHALESLTAKQIGKATDPMSVKRAQWQRWWKERSVTL